MNSFLFIYFIYFHFIYIHYLFLLLINSQLKSHYIIRQSELNDIEVSKPYDITINQAQLLALLCFAMTFASGIPIMLLLNYIIFIIYFITEKCMLLYYNSKPLRFIETIIIELTINILLICIILRLCVSCWMFSNIQIFPVTLIENHKTLPSQGLITYEYINLLIKLKKLFSNNIIIQRILNPNSFILFCLLIIIISYYIFIYIINYYIKENSLYLLFCTKDYQLNRQSYIQSHTKKRRKKKPKIFPENIQTDNYNNNNNNPNIRTDNYIRTDNNNQNTRTDNYSNNNNQNIRTDNYNNNQNTRTDNYSSNNNNHPNIRTDNNDPNSAIIDVNTRTVYAEEETEDMIDNYELYKMKHYLRKETAPFTGMLCAV